MEELRPRLSRLVKEGRILQPDVFSDAEEGTAANPQQTSSGKTGGIHRSTSTSSSTRNETAGTKRPPQWYGRDDNRTADANAPPEQQPQPDPYPAAAHYRPPPTPPIEQVRKWNCHFDGQDVYTFLEKVEEQRRGYGLQEDQLVSCLPELLRGEALLWARNRLFAWDTWAAFATALRANYLPPGEHRLLEARIFATKQAAHETARSFATNLETLMRRAGLPPAVQLDRVYYGLRPEYQRYVRRTEITNLEALYVAAAELEALSTRDPTPAARPRDAAPIRQATPPAARYSRETHCWRCKQRGHRREECRNVPRLFCSHCGTDNVYTRDCPCHQPGNGQGAGRDGSPPRPPPNNNTSWR